jgi:hypothetical protein
VLLDTGYESVYEPLLDLLTAALVKPAERNILYRYLPALKPDNTTNPASDPALLDVAGGMRDMVTEARLDRNDRTDAREMAHCPRTPIERLGDALTDRLLLLCRVNHDDDLPRVLHEWAARPCGVSEWYVLQQSVDLAAPILEVPSFEVTPTQVMAFKNFRYARSSYFDIGSRLLPFSITPSEATYVQARDMLTADRVRAYAFNLGADPESGTVAPGEVTRLQNLSGYIPESWNEALSQILGTQALMGALLGPAHPWWDPMDDSFGGTAEC